MEILQNLIPVSQKALELSYVPPINMEQNSISLQNNYYGKWHGSKIEKINSIPNDETYYWKFIVKTPDWSIERLDIELNFFY